MWEWCFKFFNLCMQVFKTVLFGFDSTLLWKMRFFPFFMIFCGYFYFFHDFLAFLNDFLHISIILVFRKFEKNIKVGNMKKF